MDKEPMQRDALVSAGRLIDSGTWAVGSVRVGEIGRLVLRVMADYIEVRRTEDVDA